MNEDTISLIEAISKLKYLAESIDFTMMATGFNQKPFHAIPMSSKKVDEDGCIWFLSGADSDHNADILKDRSCVLLYTKPSTMDFLKVYGNASVITDRDTLESLYSDNDSNWFEGIDDPNLTAIKVEPLEAQYWEPEHSKFVGFLKTKNTKAKTKLKITSCGGVKI